MIFDDGTHCLGPEYFNHVGSPAFIIHFLPLESQGKKGKVRKGISPVCIPVSQTAGFLYFKWYNKNYKDLFKPPQASYGSISFVGAVDEQ